MDDKSLSPFTTVKLLGNQIFTVTKNIDDICIYIGITKPGNDGRIGIGFYNIDEPSTRGFFPVLDGDVIKCWRALRVLEYMDEFDDLALNNASILASRGRLEEWQVKQVQPLSSIFGDLRAFRSHLLKILPKPETADSIIKDLTRYEVPFNAQSIVYEYWREDDDFLNAYSNSIADRLGVPRVNLWTSFKMFVGLA